VKRTRTVTAAQANVDRLRFPRLRVNIVAKIASEGYVVVGARRSRVYT